jgi:acyl carrier protein
MGTMTRDEVWNQIVSTVGEVLAERGEESGPLSAATTIGGDLGISSVEAIHLMITLEDRVATALSFQDLAVRDGEYVGDLALGELHEFVCRTMGLAT